ncbi:MULTISPECIES: hypothetical protein [unclassified Actinoplanes]|uniref:hypothetical protein n=1 Tax=unclassified Actinoplanes TaxID=2626549 RepID=UPI0003181C0A|nr:MULTISPECIES: hypothetical protein [unclassified Actinoplanes]
MMRSRFAPAALLCACLAALTACSADDSDAAAPTGATTRGSAPVAGNDSAPAGNGSTPAAGNGSAPAAGNGTAAAGAPGPGSTDDRTVCHLVDQAGSVMKAGISQVQRSDGHVEPADAKNVFTTFHTAIDNALAKAADSDVTTAARAVSKEIGTAAAAPDPISAAANAGFDVLSTKLTTACQSAGVTINF